MPMRSWAWPARGRRSSSLQPGRSTSTSSTPLPVRSSPVRRWRPMERDDVADAAAAVVAATESAAAVVVASPEAAAAAVVAATETESAAAAAAVVASPEAAIASAADDDDGTLKLLDEVVEKTKTMTVTMVAEQAATTMTTSLVIPASAGNKEDAAADDGRRRHKIDHEESAAANNSKAPVPVPASLVEAQTTKKKLLVLSVNGVLGDINRDFHNAHLSHGTFRGRLVFKRPFCHDFLNFCFRNFEVGVWSSRLRYNVDPVVDILMKNFKHRLLFCWDASKCTATGLYTVENKDKPLVLKELKKLWRSKEDAGDLPRKLQGEFSPSNTLLLDASPYKALRNPPHTAIFPYAYNYKNRMHDSSLGPGGDLRLYLESLAAADDVPGFVREHPFGQPRITETDPNWNFYKQILLE